MTRPTAITSLPRDGTCARLLHHLTAVAIVAAFSFSASMSFALKVGEPAPGFSATTSAGMTTSLADHAGKTVVLEWTNHDCPYVRKHYDSGTMQRLQKDATDDGIVWLSVISSRPGSQGHVTAKAANTLTTSRDAHPTAVLLDERGEIGKQYGARTTPHMYIVDVDGKLVYQGGIDDKRSPSLSTLAEATPYVREALAQLGQGEPIASATTRPYGCSVKY